MEASTPGRGPALVRAAEVALDTPRRRTGRLLAGTRLAWATGTRWFEAGCVLVVLAVSAAAAFGSHLLHGGYYLDDWKSLELSQHLSGGSAVDSLSRQWDYSGFRPVSSLYRWAIWSSPLGVHLRWNLAVALVAASVMSLLLYLVLRMLRLAVLDAAAIAVLVLVCPLADSTRLWVSASLASANISLYLVGLMLALRGVRARSVRAQVCWHAAAGAVYLAAVLFAESVSALVVATGLLYWALRSFRGALWRTAIDAPLAAAATYWISEHDNLTPRSATTFDALWERAKQMARETPNVFERVVDPYSASRWVAIVALLALAAGAVVVAVRPWAGPQRSELVRWLALAVGGLVVVLAGWVIYLPADPYYRPEQAGIGNRLNSVAAVGLVLVAWAAVRIAATLIGRVRPSRGLAAPAICGALALVLIVGSVRDSRADTRMWDTAFARERATLAFVTNSIPSPPTGSMIYVVRQSQYYSSEVPIFVAWDFRPALRFAYHGRPDIQAWAIPWSVPFLCSATQIYPQQWGWSTVQGANYGNVWVADVATGQVWRVTDAASCSAVSAAVKTLPMTNWVETIPNFPAPA